MMNAWKSEDFDLVLRESMKDLMRDLKNDFFKLNEGDDSTL